MASKDPDDSFHAVYSVFFDGFRSHMKKHFMAAQPFWLADVGDNGSHPIASIPGSPTWQCRRAEWGPVCKTVNPVM